MTFQKLTPIVIVDAIETCLPAWKSLGYQVTVQMPERGTLGFVILANATTELMLQSRASLAEDLPTVADNAPAYLLYADVASLTDAKRAATGARVLVDQRKTFYGALEAWVELPCGTILCLSERAA
jgi:hypothetical protein